MREQTMSFNVFIDTEFTDFLDPQLISIGLVAQSGEEFYAELPTRCGNAANSSRPPSFRSWDTHHMRK
jgi:hypothetical protein